MVANSECGTERNSIHIGTEPDLPAFRSSVSESSTAHEINGASVGGIPGEGQPGIIDPSKPKPAWEPRALIGVFRACVSRMIGPHAGREAAHFIRF